MNFHTQCNQYIRSLYKSSLNENGTGYPTDPNNSPIQNALNKAQGWFKETPGKISNVLTYKPEGVVDENLVRAMDQVSKDHPGLHSLHLYPVAKRMLGGESFENALAAVQNQPQNAMVSMNEDSSNPLLRLSFYERDKTLPHGGAKGFEDPFARDGGTHDYKPQRPQWLSDGMNKLGNFFSRADKDKSHVGPSLDDSQIMAGPKDMGSTGQAFSRLGDSIGNWGRGVGQSFNNFFKSNPQENHNEMVNAPSAAPRMAQSHLSGLKQNQPSDSGGAYNNYMNNPLTRDEGTHDYKPQTPQWFTDMKNGVSDGANSFWGSIKNGIGSVRDSINDYGNNLKNLNTIDQNTMEMRNSIRNPTPNSADTHMPGENVMFAHKLVDRNNVYKSIIFGDRY